MQKAFVALGWMAGALEWIVEGVELIKARFLGLDRISAEEPYTIPVGAGYCGPMIDEDIFNTELDKRLAPYLGRAVAIDYVPSPAVAVDVEVPISIVPVAGLPKRTRVIARKSKREIAAVILGLEVNRGQIALIRPKGRRRRQVPFFRSWQEIFPARDAEKLAA